MTFLVNRNNNKYASGTILVDDGISIDSYDKNNYVLWNVRVTESAINFLVEEGNAEYSPAGQVIDELQEIRILNASDLSEANFACYMDKETFDLTDMQMSYNKDYKYLSIKPTGAA